MKAMIFDRKLSDWYAQAFFSFAFIYLFFQLEWMSFTIHPHVLAFVSKEAALLVQLLRAEKKTW